MFVERYLPARAPGRLVLPVRHRLRLRRLLGRRASLHGRRVGGVASYFHLFSSGGDRSHPERSEGGMRRGRNATAAKSLKIPVTETPE